MPDDATPQPNPASHTEIRRWGGRFHCRILSLLYGSVWVGCMVVLNLVTRVVLDQTRTEPYDWIHQENYSSVCAQPLTCFYDDHMGTTSPFPTWLDNHSSLKNLQLGVLLLGIGVCILWIGHFRLIDNEDTARGAPALEDREWADHKGGFYWAPLLRFWMFLASLMVAASLVEDDDPIVARH